MTLTRVQRLRPRRYMRTITSVMTSRRYVATMIVATAGLVMLAVGVPVALTPGNTVAYQLSLMTPVSMLLTAVFSVLFGLMMGLQRYAMDVRAGGIWESLRGGGSGVSGFVGAFFAGPLCVSCLSTIFAAIGIGGAAALTVVTYRTEILVASSLFLLFALARTAHTIEYQSQQEGCTTCREEQ